MIRKTAPLAAIVGLVCVALLLLQFIEPGRAQDEPSGPMSTQAESLPADAAGPVSAAESPAASAPQVPAAASAAAPTVPPQSTRSPRRSSSYPVIRSSGASAAAPTITYGAAGMDPQPAVQASSNQAGSMMGQAGAAMGGMMGAAMGEMVQGPSGPQFQQRLAEETQDLLQATTPEGKQQATETLGKLLGEYFDSDMQRRQADLEKVKQRVAKLEELLSKRQAAKQEIVDLQLKTMVNESEGLGFFSPPAPGQPGAINDPFDPQLPMANPVPGSGMMPGMPGMWPAPQAVR